MADHKVSKKMSILKVFFFGISVDQDVAQKYYLIDIYDKLETSQNLRYKCRLIASD